MRLEAATSITESADRLVKVHYSYVRSGLSNCHASFLLQTSKKLHGVFIVFHHQGAI